MTNSLIRVGCCGFQGSKEKYFKHFDLVELQSTFYKLPRPETALRWHEEAPQNFTFTMKAWQGITHLSTSPTYRRAKLQWEPERLRQLGHFQNTEEAFKAWERTAVIAGAVNAKVIVFQCPPNFKQNEAAIQNLQTFFKFVERDNFLFAVEFRANWERSVIKQLCDELNLIHCVDPFKEQTVSAKIRYFRLHGAPPGKQMYRYQFSDSDLERLKNLILKDNGAEEIFCLFNNIAMFDDARRFRKMIFG
ncbi:MAG: DUF72 domain-containing protein [Calditrichaeota bacterium]|nr:DUF72 domain-containing protein [Calditrichota bacterium]